MSLFNKRSTGNKIFIVRVFTSFKPISSRCTFGSIYRNCSGLSGYMQIMSEQALRSGSTLPRKTWSQVSCRLHHVSPEDFLCDCYVYSGVKFSLMAKKLKFRLETLLPADFTVAHVPSGKLSFRCHVRAAFLFPRFIKLWLVKHQGNCCMQTLSFHHWNL